MDARKSMFDFMFAQSGIPSGDGLAGMLTQGAIGGVSVLLLWQVLKQASDERQRASELNEKRDEYMQRFLNEFIKGQQETINAINANTATTNALASEVRGFSSMLMRTDSGRAKS
jgi:hypothetical protein